LNSEIPQTDAPDTYTLNLYHEVIKNILDIHTEEYPDADAKYERKYLIRTGHIII
jgi:hypothetical protein